MTKTEIQVLKERMIKAKLKGFIYQRYGGFKGSLEYGIALKNKKMSMIKFEKLFDEDGGLNLLEDKKRFSSVTIKQRKFHKVTLMVF